MKDGRGLIIGYKGLDGDGTQWRMGNKDLELKVKKKKLYNCRKE